MESGYLRSINELKDKHFSIPSYQRGYRWGEREVDALLNDIWDFSQMENPPSFYCLQPVVVKKQDDQYIAIDGQQRLTTIFLIIKFIENKDFFTIDYQTRLKSADFLKDIHHRIHENAENIDFYHFIEAYKNIKEFFKDDRIDKDEFLNTLLNKCKVLWYEVKNEREEDVFVRLNIGKIPLTQAENIKALFLSKNNEMDSDELRERAEFWYESELKAREERDFRYCVLSKVDEKDIAKDEEDKPVIKDDISRIEVYLKACLPKDKTESRKDLFDYFYESYKSKTLNEEWDKLNNAIRNLSGFASKGRDKIDREIFHYLGFLIFYGGDIASIYNLWQKNKNKESFAQELLKEIKKKLSRIGKIEELTYGGKDNKNLQSFLLLFNLAYMIDDESSNDYFQFNRFVLEEWSIEHIYAQNSKSIAEEIKSKNSEEIVKWLEEVSQYIEDRALKKNIDSIEKKIQENGLEKEKLKEEFDDLLNRIDENFKESENLNKIGNLTLLDKKSNSSIGNYIFSKKRKEIQRLGEQDKLIPICTKKVFEKVFSTKKDNPDIFTKQDQEDYLKSIREKLEKYK